MTRKLLTLAAVVGLACLTAQAQPEHRRSERPDAPPQRGQSADLAAMDNPVAAEILAIRKMRQLATKVDNPQRIVDLIHRLRENSQHAQVQRAAFFAIADIHEKAGQPMAAAETLARIADVKAHAGPPMGMPPSMMQRGRPMGMMGGRGTSMDEGMGRHKPAEREGARHAEEGYRHKPAEREGARHAEEGIWQRGKHREGDPEQRRIVEELWGERRRDEGDRKHKGDGEHEGDREHRREGDRQREGEREHRREGNREREGEREHRRDGNRKREGEREHRREGEREREGDREHALAGDMEATPAGMAVTEDEVLQLLEISNRMLEQLRRETPRP